MAVLVAFVSCLGSNVEELGLSDSTIHRHWRIHREAKVAEIEESFSPTVPLTIHWGGKLMPSLTNGCVVDRFPILVSGEGICPKSQLEWHSLIDEELPLQEKESFVANMKAVD